MLLKKRERLLSGGTREDETVASYVHECLFWITTLCGEDYALSSAFKAFLSIYLLLKRWLLQNSSKSENILFMFMIYPRTLPKPHLRIHYHSISLPGV